MAVVLRSFSLNRSPAQVWAVVSDLSRWQTLFKIADAEEKGWGNRWRAAGGSGVGMTVEMLFDDKVVQVWEAQRWKAPEHLTVASREWKGKSFLAMRSSLDIGLTAVSAEETAVEIQLSAEFSYPMLGRFLNQIVPLKRDLNRTLSMMEQGIVAAL